MSQGVSEDKSSDKQNESSESIQDNEDTNYKLQDNINELTRQLNESQSNIGALTKQLSESQEVIAGLTEQLQHSQGSVHELTKSLQEREEAAKSVQEKQEFDVRIATIIHTFQ